MDAGTERDGKRRQVCSTWDTIAQARDEVARVRTEVKSGTYVGKAETTVSDYLEEWLAGLHDVKPKTVLGYRDALRVVMDAHGSRPLQGLTKAHVSELVSDMLVTGGRKGVGRSPRTVALILTDLLPLVAFFLASLCTLIYHHQDARHEMELLAEQLT
jgi:hypothetical protein